jgi:branched-chain amino acid transport system substrate-binding protein
MTSRFSLIAALLAGLLAGGQAAAQKKYDTGATDTEIKIGQTAPFSGPASGYSAGAKAEAAYFQMVNDRGGINGRKINFISIDDAFSPPKTIEATRRLVEQDGVLAVYGQIGSSPNTAIHRYMNSKKVPHLFIGASANKWNDPKNFPWTVPLLPSEKLEARLIAQQILKSRPDAKIAVLYQNDDMGKDYVKGLKDGLGDKAANVIAEASYEISDPTVDSQIVNLQKSGATVFVNFCTLKAAAQAIRKIHDLGWTPDHYLNAGAASIPLTLVPAGVQRSMGIYAFRYMKDPADEKWASDPAMKEYLAFMEKYMPGADVKNTTYVYGYNSAWLMTQVLKNAGDNLTRENLLKHATSLKSVQLPLVLPGIVINTTPNDYEAFRAMMLFRFDGTRWAESGELIGSMPGKSPS